MFGSGDKDISIVVRVIDAVTGPIKEAGQGIAGFVDKAKGYLKGLAVAAASYAVGKFFADSVREAREAEDAIAQLEASVRSTGGAAGFTAKELKGQADALSRLTNFSSEAVQGGLSRLLGYTDIQGESFKRASRASLDMAQALGIDVSSAAEKVGNALNYPTQSLNSLTKQGFRFTEDQKAMIVQMERAGDMAGAQAIILGELELAYGGSAEAAGQTFTGALDKLGKAWGGIKEAVGNAIIGNGELNGSMGLVTESLIKVEEWIVANEEAIGGFVTNVVGGLKFVAEVLGTSISGWMNFFEWLGHAATEIGFAWDGIGPAVKKMAGNVLLTLSSLVGESRIFLTIFGDAAVDMANQMGDAGVRMVRDASKSQRDIKAGRELYYKELAGTTAEGELRLTTLASTGGRNRTTLTAEELAAQEEARKEAAKRLEKLTEEINVNQVMLDHQLTEAKAKEYLQRERDLGRHQEIQVATVTQARMRIDQQNTMLAAGFNERIIPAVRQTTEEIGKLPMMATKVPPLTDAFDALATKTGLTREEVEDLVKAGKTYNEATGEWVDSTDNVAEGFEKTARMAGDVAGSLGLIDEKGVGLFNTMINVGSAIKDALVGGFTTGGVIGIIAGVGSLLKGFFGGKSQAQIQAERLLNRNNELMREQIDLLRITTPGGKLAHAQNTLQSLLTPDLIRILSSTGGGADGFKARGNAAQGLHLGLAKAGLSLTDLNTMAKDLGLEGILDSNGKLVAKALEQLLERLMDASLATFGDSIASQLARIQTELRTGVLSPEEELAETIKVLSRPGLQGSSAIADAFAGINLGSTEGRAAGASAVQDLVKKLASGQLSTAAFGGLSPDQFRQTLEDLFALLTAEVEQAVADVVGDVTSPAGLDLGAGEASTGIVPAVTGSLLAGGGLTVPGPSVVDVLVDVRTHLAGIHSLLERAALDLTTTRAAGGQAVTVNLHQTIQVFAGDQNPAELGRSVEQAVRRSTPDQVRAISRALHDETQSREALLGIREFKT